MDEGSARHRLSDQAYDALRGMIVRGALAPNSRLVEATLAARLGIGRTPLREAILRLAEDDLIVVIPQSGSFVAPIRADRVAEAQFVREHLESAIIRETARAIDAAGLARLERILRHQREASREGNPDLFYSLDEELHAAFAAIAGRPAVWRLVARNKVHLDRVRRLSLPMPLQIPRLIRQHTAIVAALAAADPTAAETALRLHLKEVFATMKTLGLEDEGGRDHAPSSAAG